MADDPRLSEEEPTPLETAEAALERLARRLARPSVQAQVRRLLPKIEQAIEAGATHEQIVETLCASGIPLSMATFRSALYRARKKLDDGSSGGSGKGGSGGAGSAGPAAGGAGGSPGGGAAAGAGAASAAGAVTERSGRDPLALPARPRAFEWDPTARPEVTFVSRPEGRDTEP